MPNGLFWQHLFQIKMLEYFLRALNHHLKNDMLTLHVFLAIKCIFLVVLILRQKEVIYKHNIHANLI